MLELDIKHTDGTVSDYADPDENDVPVVADFALPPKKSFSIVWRPSEWKKSHYPLKLGRIYCFELYGNMALDGGGSSMLSPMFKLKP